MWIWCFTLGLEPHRRNSLHVLSTQKVAWTCCWLATKLEEIPRRVRDVLAVFYRLQRRRQDLSLEPLDFYGSVRITVQSTLVLPDLTNFVVFTPISSVHVCASWLLWCCVEV